MWACRRIEARLLVTAVRGGGRPPCPRRALAAWHGSGARPGTPRGRAVAWIWSADHPRSVLARVRSTAMAQPRRCCFTCHGRQIRLDYERPGVRARRCTDTIQRRARSITQPARLTCGFRPRGSRTHKLTNRSTPLADTVQPGRHRPLRGVHRPATGGPSRTTACSWIGGRRTRPAGTPGRHPALCPAASAFTSGSHPSRITITSCLLSPGMSRAETRRQGGAP